MLTPASETELSETIKAAKSPLRIIGGGTRPIGQVETDETLSVSKLSGIELYEPGALTIVAKAGTPMAEIEKALAKENQRLPFEPMDHRVLLGTKGAPTIGGVVAGNISGPRRVAVGACRDFLLGVRFVDGQGTIVKNGGRVMKNVTGYDLVKLMCGSWGTLGVLTEVAFKVLPAVDARAVLLIEGLSNEEAVATLSKALGSPFEVMGAAHVPVGVDGDPVTMIRLEGFEDSVAYRADALSKLLGHPAKIERDMDKTAAGWAWVRDVEAFKGAQGDVWRISCKPSDGPDLAARLNAEQLIFDWGGGLIWAHLPAGTDARTRLGEFKGHATLVKGMSWPTFQPEPAPVAALSAGLRAKFDPRAVLNPGLLSAEARLAS